MCEQCATRASDPANINLFKVNNRDSTNKCEIYSQLTIKPLERGQRRLSDTSIVNFGHIKHFYCWVWTCICSPGKLTFNKFQKTTPLCVKEHSIPHLEKRFCWHYWSFWFLLWLFVIESLKTRCIKRLPFTANTPIKKYLLKKYVMQQITITIQTLDTSNTWLHIY